MLTQRLRHRVTVQQKVTTQDGNTGAISYVWQDYAVNVPAEVLTGPGREFDAADAKQAETTARITMRWFPGLLASMRILWDSRAYDILSMETDATARREWRLRCKDGPTDGS